VKRVWSCVLAGLMGLLSVPDLIFAQSTTTTSIANVVTVSPVAGLASLPLQRDDRAEVSSGISLLVQVILVVSTLLVLAGVYMLRQRRTVQRGPAIALATGQSVRLAQGISLHAVTWGQEEILIACSTHGITLLSKRERGTYSQAQDEEK
jgi:hypothetical protein